MSPKLWTNFSLLLWCSVAQVQGFVTTGTIAVTDTDYEKFYSSYSTYIPKISQRVFEMTGDGRSEIEATQCIRSCFLTPGCYTAVHRPTDGMCILSTVNRCRSPTTYLLQTNDDIYTYDVRKTSTPQTIITCFRECVNANHQPKPCDACGRLHCSGEHCDNCNTTCWSDPNISGSTYFWRSLYSPTHATCSGGWQTIFKDRHLSSYAELFEVELVLKLVISYIDESFQSFFDGFEGTGAITVGEYLGGNAGNYWEAPFTARSVLYPSQSNCIGFYYQPSLAECHVEGLISYDEQKALNASLEERYVKKRFKWLFCDGSMEGKNVANIEMQVIPKVMALEMYPDVFEESKITCPSDD